MLRNSKLHIRTRKKSSWNPTIQRWATVSGVSPDMSPWRWIHINIYFYINRIINTALFYLTVFCDHLFKLLNTCIVIVNGCVVFCCMDRLCMYVCVYVCTYIYSHTLCTYTYSSYFFLSLYYWTFRLVLIFFFHSQWWDEFPNSVY